MMLSESSDGEKEADTTSSPVETTLARGKETQQVMQSPSGEGPEETRQHHRQETRGRQLRAQGLRRARRRLFSPKPTDRKSQAAEGRAPLCLGGKGSACRRRRLEFDPWVGKMPWRTGWHPRRWSCLGILWTEGPGGLLGSPESGTTERLNSSHKPGEGLEGCYRHEE